VRRAEFWYRKISTYPEVMGQAKAEAKDLIVNKLAKPATWTWGDLVTGGICGIQVFGAFCIGEVIGRQNLYGYPVGDRVDHLYH